MNIEQQGSGDQIIVPVPLDEYLGLLSAREVLNRPVRTHAQAAQEYVARVLDKAVVLKSPEIRARKMTQRNCDALAREMLTAVRRFSYWYYSEEQPRPISVFTPCLYRYIYFYDESKREEMMQQREDFRAKISNVPSLGLGLDAAESLYPLPKTQEPPNLVEYKYQLSSQLRPLLPLYVATYFIPKSYLSIPPEIEQVLS